MWNRNTEETVHGHCPENQRERSTICAWTRQMKPKIQSARKHSAFGTNTREAIRNEMEVRPSPVWHWHITILRCYSFMFTCWQLCCVKWFLWSACIFQSILQVICQWQWLSDMIWAFGSGPNLKTLGGKVFRQCPCIFHHWHLVPHFQHPQFYNNNNNKHDNVYGAVIMAEPLREFTRFIWWM